MTVCSNWLRKTSFNDVLESEDSASRISLLNWFIGKASVLIVFSDLIIRGRLSLFQFNLEIYTKYFTLPIVKLKYEAGCTAMAIYRFIQKKGYTGGYTLVKTFCRNYKQAEMWIQITKATWRWVSNSNSKFSRGIGQKSLYLNCLFYWQGTICTYNQIIIHFKIPHYLKSIKNTSDLFTNFIKYLFYKRQDINVFAHY